MFAHKVKKIFKGVVDFLRENLNKIRRRSIANKGLVHKFAS